jgi:nucleolar MIF4G domain-containing protein 1
MIETLTNLKNNKLKRNAAQNQGGDAVDRMKKFLSGLSKKRHSSSTSLFSHPNSIESRRQVLAHEPLRVSLEDLHSAESKGKWWLVGAAWGGDPLLDRRHESKSVDEKAIDCGSNDLLALAKKQGMNTDVRRSIFVVLMSSDVCGIHYTLIVVG